ncbi:MAG TPA: response regulator [Solirubrobacteraceae bacterium]
MEIEVGALQAIWERNRDEVLAQVDLVGDAVTDALAGSLSPDNRGRAAREAHKLAGSVGTFGFVAASEHARALELGLGAPEGPARADLRRLAEHVVALRRELGAERNGSPPTSTPVAQADGAVALIVVDDDRERGRSLLAAADARGVRALLAADLESARRLIDEAAPEVVLLKLSIQGVTGPALRFLAEVSVERPVMTLTGAEEEIDRVEVARHGGRGFLAPSLEPSEIIAAALDLRERVRVRGTRILAVDDDAVVLGLLRSVLGEADFTVATCQDPTQFWERLEEVSPDLVVLDFDMPKISGPDLCRAVRNDSRWAGLPVIFLTSRLGPDSVRTVFDAGADDYLSKPFVGPEVVARIGNRLERVRLYRALAETDVLTGLPNRRRALESLGALLRMAARQQQPASLAVLDVDRFKSINDTHGHLGGDAVLRELGAVLRQFFRGEDVVGRWGGDELVVGMYGLGNADARERLGELVEDVRGRRFHSGRIAVTLSIGVAEYPTQGSDIDQLYRAADAALYRAKVAGRDRVVPAGAQPDHGQSAVDVAIVEDDTVLGQLLTHALQTRGYRTRWITDGVQAASELGGAEPGLRAPVLLLDWDLPGLDGLRVLRTLREHGVLDRTQVIMLTARGAEGEVVQALEAGAIDHVTKPFSVPVLMQRVRRAMEH